VRFMTMIKMDESVHTGQTPPGVYEAMAAFEQEGRVNGTLIELGGLLPSSAGAIVSLANGRIKAVDGPFAEAKELVAGYWIWQVRDMDEALEWARRCPNPSRGEGVLELRPVFEDDDFGDEYTPELRERDAALRAQVAEQTGNA
jgi:hypothetical protein